MSSHQRPIVASARPSRPPPRFRAPPPRRAAPSSRAFPAASGRPSRSARRRAGATRRSRRRARPTSSCGDAVRAPAAVADCRRDAAPDAVRRRRRSTPGTAVDRESRARAERFGGALAVRPAASARPPCVQGARDSRRPRRVAAAAVAPRRGAHADRSTGRRARAPAAASSPAIVARWRRARASRPRGVRCLPSDGIVDRQRVHQQHVLAAHRGLAAGLQREASGRDR